LEETVLFGENGVLIATFRAVAPLSRQTGIGSISRDRSLWRGRTLAMPKSAEAHRDAIERRTFEVGRVLFEKIDTSGPSVFERQWWDDWIMNWSMADESTKVQLFRFIDVLPMLDTIEELAEHFQAYFAESQGQFPTLVRLGANLADPGTMGGRLVARAIRLNATRIGRRFIAGTNPAEVIDAVKRLRAKGMTFSMDLLGEATITEREADAYQREYLDLLADLGPEAARWREAPTLDRDPYGPLPRINLSIKVSALNSQFDPIDPAGSARVAAARLREVFRAAQCHGALINVDMEQYSFKDLTLAIFRDLLTEPEFRDWPNVGVAIQAYLRDTERDLRDLLRWVKRRGTPVWVRLVKGAYWDYETLTARQMHWPVPVFTQKWQSDACFERCSAFLMQNHRWLRPAIASHNVRSLAHAMAVAEHLELPPRAYELQMLFGMGDPLKTALVARGERLRIYTPFGKLLPGMAYLVRRLLENTSNTSFLRQTFTEHTAMQQLLRPPDAVGREYHEVHMDRIDQSPDGIAPFSNEPLTDFACSVNRERMAAALASVKAEFGREYPLWIGGAGGEAVRSTQLAVGRNAPAVVPIAYSPPPPLESRNPADHTTIIGYVARATREHADMAVAAATAAFPVWSAATVWRRVEVLFETAARLRERRFELAAWMVFECGKQWREADADVAEAIDFCEFYARGMLQLAAPRQRNIPGEDNSYFYLPRGVVAVISPWNFPLAILCGMTMAPLVAGNTVVIKPAEQSSVVAAKFTEILQSLDLPYGVVNFVPGVGEEVGARLVEHPDVAAITFTGSQNVGLEINRIAAQTSPGQHHVKHVIAEMGGKNAIIIDDDADLDEAVRGVVASAFGYQGQKCSACSRVIVLPKVYAAFEARLRDAVASLAIGPPEDPAYAIGPVIDREAFERLKGSIAKARGEATCLYAGDPGKLAEVGYYVGPHVFSDVDPKSMLGQVEFFGPVLSVLRAANMDEALAIANGTPYALTGGVFSRNPATIARAKREFLVGNLYINRKITGALVDCQPFGGFKLSGVGGKAGGPDYLKQFLVPRTITENTLRRGFAPQQAEM
jgi:RHH-type proline utilization regulon transcriptional repressor/proline dehydrogenase/delta 1-pyrroline-5-carboxylate dehydrogenase